jgi:hypothetical protein
MKEDIDDVPDASVNLGGFEHEEIIGGTNRHDFILNEDDMDTQEVLDDEEEEPLEESFIIHDDEDDLFED